MDQTTSGDVAVRLRPFCATMPTADLDRLGVVPGNTDSSAGIVAQLCGITPPESVWFRIPWDPVGDGFPLARKPAHLRCFRCAFCDPKGGR